MYLVIYFTNSGNGPAQVTDVGLDINFIMRGDRLPGVMTPRSWRGETGILGFGMTQEFRVPNCTGPIAVERLTSVFAGREDIVCFGFVEYIDAGAIYGEIKIRKTAFHRVLNLTPGHGAGTGRFDLPKEPDPDYEYED